jgi:hypothetical protein
MMLNMDFICETDQAQINRLCGDLLGLLVYMYSMCKQFLQMFTYMCIYCTSLS